MGYTVKAMRQALEEALIQVRKSLQLHRGGINLVSLDEETGVVTLQFTGACAGCGLKDITMKKGIEVVLCEKVPGITKILTTPFHV